MNTGILALQGNFQEHSDIIKELGACPVAVRQPEQLEGLDGLIIPGGESTTILKLMHDYRLFQPIRELALGGLPVMGTCAGTVLLAKKVCNPDMQSLALIDIEVRRNAFGRQVDSFESSIHMPLLGDEPFTAVFIRAPVIEASGPCVEILGRLPDSRIAAVRQDNMLAFSFHPELSEDSRVHRCFLEMTTAFKAAGGTDAIMKAATSGD